MPKVIISYQYSLFFDSLLIFAMSIEVIIDEHGRKKLKKLGTHGMELLEKHKTVRSADSRSAAAAANSSSQSHITPSPAFDLQQLTESIDGGLNTVLLSASSSSKSVSSNNSSLMDHLLIANDSDRDRTEEMAGWNVDPFSSNVVKHFDGNRSYINPGVNPANIAALVGRQLCVEMMDDGKAFQDFPLYRFRSYQATTYRKKTMIARSVVLTINRKQEMKKMICVRVLITMCPSPNVGVILFDPACVNNPNAGFELLPNVGKHHPLLILIHNNCHLVLYFCF